MYPMFVNDQKIMVLRYKPEKGDIIRDDDTNEWYRVLSIDGRTVKATYSYDPRHSTPY